MAWDAVDHRHRQFLHHLQHGRGPAASHGGRAGLDPARLRLLRHPDPALGLGAAELGLGGLHPIFRQWRLGEHWTGMSDWDAGANFHLAR